MKTLALILILTLCGFTCPEGMAPVILDGEQYCTKDDPKEVEQNYREWLAENAPRALVQTQLGEKGAE